jgi:hypothetical protein
VFHSYADAGLPIFIFFTTSNLLIELIEGQLKVSTQIRDRDGDIVAELTRNEWRIASRAFDRNYSKDALEVKNAAGRIVLQVKILPDRIQLHGEWWGENGQGVRAMRHPEGGGALFLPLHANIPDTGPFIEPLFQYPSELHFGELRK